METRDRLIIRGAREHNLKDVSLDLPRNALIVFTGLSGSGKSSLAFDTIFAEGQRRYVESLSAYARQFQKPEAALQLTAEGLARWVRDDSARTNYISAFQRSSFEGMLNYYKANYPREPYTAPAIPGPKVKCPVLMFHGLKDQALLPAALNDTWKWIEKDLTLVTVPEADHWVQQDASDLVTRTMISWLNR